MKTSVVTVPSSKGEREYNVTISYEEGRWTTADFACTCPDALYRPYKHCKHVRRVYGAFMKAIDKEGLTFEAEVLERYL